MTKFTSMKSKLYRQIDVFDKKTDGLVREIALESFDLELMKSNFKISLNDPLMYNPYEIDTSKAYLFPEIKFEFKKYDYFLACFRGLSKTEIEILTINKFCKPAQKERLIGLLKSNRKKFCKNLAHFESLDLSLFDNIIKNEKEFIKLKAKKNGIAQVQIISESSKFDRKIMELDTCLSSVLFLGYGNIIIFGESKFIFFEGEGINNRWISK